MAAGAGDSLSSLAAAKAAGSTWTSVDFVSAVVTTPGSTMLTCMPLGIAVVLPSSRTTCASTPSDGPTQSGSEAPRISAVGFSGGEAWNSRSFQSDHLPVSALRVRTCAVPSSGFSAASQETPSSEKSLVVVRGSSFLEPPPGSARS